MSYISKLARDETQPRSLCICLTVILSMGVSLVLVLSLVTISCSIPFCPAPKIMNRAGMQIPPRMPRATPNPATQNTTAMGGQQVPQVLWGLGIVVSSCVCVTWSATALPPLTWDPAVLLC